MEKVNEICTKFDLDHYGDVPLIKKASEMTGVAHQHIVLGLVVLAALFTLSPPGMVIVTAISTFLWPCYLSYKALESEQGMDDKRWLTYWVAFAFIFCFDEVFRRILFFVPFYGIIRIAGLVYIYYIRKDGTQLFYDKVVSPIFNKLGSQLDQAVAIFEEITLMSEKEK